MILQKYIGYDITTKDFVDYQVVSYSNDTIIIQGDVTVECETCEYVISDSGYQYSITSYIFDGTNTSITIGKIFDGSDIVSFYSEPLLLSDTLTQGYSDISTIENFHNLSNILLGEWDIDFDLKSIINDWRKLKDEIKNLVISKAGDDLSGWDNLTQTEKEIACEYMLPYINAVDKTLLFSTFNNDIDTIMFLSSEYDRKSTISRKKRHYNARVITLNYSNDIQNALYSIKLLSKLGYIDSYIGGLEGTVVGDSEGYFDWLMHTSSFTPRLISSFQDNSTVIIQGDETDNIIQDTISIYDSVNNDGVYSLDSVMFDGTNTAIKIKETFPDISDTTGNIYINGILSMRFADKSLQSKLISCYRDGIY